MNHAHRDPSVADTSAVSLDGRRFEFTGSIESPLAIGDFVTLSEPNGLVQIGQIEDIEIAEGESLIGSGSILGISEAGGGLDRRSTSAFSHAEVQAADAGTVELIYAGSGATLSVGALLSDAEIPARLLPHRFNRHTFWCGQSGSGKTYALGVVLEQLLIHTSLPMVILDPNSDFVRLREATGDASGPLAADRLALASRNIRVLRPGVLAQDSLRVRFTDMTIQARAAVLRLDPLVDREEYNELVHLEVIAAAQDAAEIIPKLRSRGTPAALALAARIENLDIVRWDVWAGPREAVTEVVDTRPDATVVDLGGFNYPDEYLVVALALLEDLWAKRESRRPLLIVIDEAHNLCSPDASGPLQRAVRDRIVQIAAEGRKFGLWLLLSTQRPSKVHPNIISQCDNLALMKITSPIDLDEMGTIFGFVPKAMLQRSTRFRQGEALFAGGFVPAPTMISMGGRLTREGGIDVSVPLRNQ